jgi:hypothetical protein
LPNDYYPRWLKNENYRTNQTSGITFIEEDEKGNDVFLLVDDIGKIHKLEIQSDTVFIFNEIYFSTEVFKYLNTFPKIDFEEIVYDKYTGDVFISIEGNGADYLQYNGIYKLEFKDDNISSNMIVDIKKIEFNPNEKFIQYVRKNIGYEGVAINDKYFILGLEGILNPDKSFSGNTLLLVVNKSDFKIIKEIYTEEFNIVSIGGLFSDSESLVWGIDRNNRTLFNLKFDDSLNVTSFKKTKIKTVIPFYHNFEYTGSLESIAMNTTKNIFLVDDPWHSRFVPDSSILVKLDEVTVKNYKDFVPIIHKFNME